MKTIQITIKNIETTIKTIEKTIKPYKKYKPSKKQKTIKTINSWEILGSPNAISAPFPRRASSIHMGYN